MKITLCATARGRIPRNKRTYSESEWARLVRAPNSSALCRELLRQHMMVVAAEWCKRQQS
jgi:hypothetical protein